MNWIEQPKTMPKEITLDDGSKETVYTKEEVAGIQKGADKNKERKDVLNKLGENLEVKEGETIDDKIKEMKELSNPNFAKYRVKFKAMEKRLKEDGKQIDENGNLVDSKQVLSSEDIQKRIDETVKTEVNKFTNSSARDKALSNFSQEDKDIIKPHLDKLMMAYPDDLQGNLEIAAKKAFPVDMPDQVKQTLSSAGGLAPNITTDDKKKFTDTDEGKQMLSDILPPNVKKALEAKEKKD